LEFGKLPSLLNIDWSLGELRADTAAYLKSNPKIDAQYYIGTPAWGHKEWIGKIYPDKTQASQYLNFYSKNFSCIELNTTHYRIADSEQIKKWLSQVPADFRFCPKVFNGISHTVNGLRDKNLLSKWLQMLDLFRENLGPCFIQFHHHFDYSQKAQLHAFLENWPAEYKLSIELRHHSWFTNKNLHEPLAHYLRRKNIGTVITDVAGRRDLSHLTVTAPWTMVRFIGNGLHESDFSRMQAWQQVIQNLKDLGLRQLYFFVHQPDDLLSPEMSIFAIEKLNQVFIDKPHPNIQWLQLQQQILK
jgi:uncharacterized protein YecE (DUF72 family)